MTDLEAGPALDAKIAERVMGLTPGVDFGSWPEHDWKRTENGEIDNWAWDTDNHGGPSCVRCYYGYCDGCQDAPTEPCEVEPPTYSTNITCAWEVVERMGELGHIKWQVDHDQDGYTAMFSRLVTEGSDQGWQWVQRSAKTAPIAIVRAALAAVS